MRPLIFNLLPLILALPLGAAEKYDPEMIRVGKTLYEESCSKCHGPDGKGVAKETLNIQTDVPDLTVCADAGEETDYKWFLILSNGGPWVGLTADMPSFELYTPEQRWQAIAYSRTFCTENWVRGELNFERTLTTEKAYPENEMILSPVIAHSRETGTSFEFRNIIERRVGNRFQLEAALPVTARDSLSARSVVRGIGDGEIGAKYVLAHSFDHLFIASAGIDLSAPTGKFGDGLGHGTWIAEPYLASGKALNKVVLQGQVKWEIPFNEAKAEREFIYRADVGFRARPDPRGIFPSLEIVGEGEHVALIPQVRLGVSRTGKWAMAMGVRRPVHGDTSERFAIIGYLLWEYLGR